MEIETASLTVSLASAVGACVAGMYARRATKASERSANASEESARQAKRSADADQEIAAHTRAEAERTRVDFNLSHKAGDRYILSNQGTESAYGVNVDCGDRRVEPQQTWFETFPDGHEVSFLLPRTFGTTTTHLKVTYHLVPDESDPEIERELLIE